MVLHRLRVGAWHDAWHDDGRPAQASEQATAASIKQVIAWQLAEEMKRQNITNKRLAELMNPSRAQIDRIPDPEKGNVTIETLQRAAALLGPRSGWNWCDDTEGAGNDPSRRGQAP